MDIGTEQETYEIEPLVDPVPREEPLPAPEPEPVQEPEKVPA
jgi:hypothetical protein